MHVAGTAGGQPAVERRSRYCLPPPRPVRPVRLSGRAHPDGIPLRCPARKYRPQGSQGAGYAGGSAPWLLDQSQPRSRHSPCGGGGGRATLPSPIKRGIALRPRTRTFLDPGCTANTVPAERPTCALSDIAAACTDVHLSARIFIRLAQSITELFFCRVVGCLEFATTARYLFNASGQGIVQTNDLGRNLWDGFGPLFPAPRG